MEYRNEASLRQSDYTLKAISLMKTTKENITPRTTLLLEILIEILGQIEYAWLGCLLLTSHEKPPAFAQQQPDGQSTRNFEL